MGSPTPNRNNGQDRHMPSAPLPELGPQEPPSFELGAQEPPSFELGAQEPPSFELGAQEPPSLNDCLRVNRLYQDELMHAIKKLEELLAMNHENKEMLRVNTANPRKRPGQLAPRKRSRVVFTHPYFKDISGIGPPMNEDEVSRRRLCLQDPYLRRPKPWLEKDIASLQTSIRNNLIKTIMESCMERKLSLDQLCGMTNHSIDWLSISINDVGVNRTPQQCELMWKNKLSGNISAWTAKEDATLKELVAKLGRREWDKVAAQLGGRRTPFQCAERYMQHFSKHITSGAFTKEEDMKLLKLINEHTVDGEIQWNKVTFFMPSRTRMQLCYRWERVLSPNLRRGKFSEDEDKMLVIAVEAYGHDWVTVKEYLPGRTAHQCRERQVNKLSRVYARGHTSGLELRSRVGSLS
ncbi:snRNA-activating protein complex subunit 4-like [Dermacentor silvarum]|uniref:snRNA-activating protein complex subunit 4-like n=1 Tax=Dermacentor silvarum TaxID=543639 RepID=UPI002100781C|nr:snRNA-activating protein complex subunit 4-like [Dermacentor silvarum]